jgi:phytoene synthase
MAALQQALLAEIRGADYSVLSQRITLTPLRRLWIAWRTRRRAHRSNPAPHPG